jgi:hypothetical protein
VPHANTATTYGGIYRSSGSVVTSHPRHCDESELHRTLSLAAAFLADLIRHTLDVAAAAMVVVALEVNALAIAAGLMAGAIAVATGATADPIAARFIRAAGVVACAAVIRIGFQLIDARSVAARLERGTTN